MLHNHFLLYLCGHETHRNSPTIGRSAHLSHASDRERQIQSGDCRYFRNLQNVCEPMVPVISEERQIRACPQESIRTPSEAVIQRESKASKITIERAFGFGLCNGLVDTGENLRYDAKEDGGRISSPSCMENPEKDELDLPKARAKSLATKRKRDRKLEAVQMAAYKKTFNDLAPTWCLRTKAASFLRQMLSIPGLRKVKPHIFITGLSKTKYLRSVRFPCLQFGEEHDSSFVLNAGMLPAKISFSFSSIFLNICKGTSFLFGTAARYIAAKLFKRFFVSIRGFMCFVFRHTHRSSIRLNISGLNLIQIWRTDNLEILTSYRPHFANQYVRDAVHNHYFALVCIGANYFVKQM